MKAKQDNWFKQYLYCDALLLQFREPKVYDMPIPSAGNVYGLVSLSLRILSGETIPVSKVNCVSSDKRYPENYISLEKLKSVLEDKVLAKGLFNSLDDLNNNNSLLTWYMNFRQDIFNSDWVYLQGDWYRFRDGQREKAEQRVLENLPASHIDKIKLIGDTFQPYIGATNSACKCK